tara:strand:+ start:5845 stop:6030 length:186 start_codon:yes stop_codon:yes gene_type:complete
MNNSLLVYCPDCNCPDSFTDLGIFISGILLSVGGLIAIVGSQVRQSSCLKIKSEIEKINNI